MKSQTNRGGFTLVELMVVAAVMSILIVGFAQFMSFQNRANQTAKVDSEVVDVRRLVSGWFQNKNVCTQTLMGFSPLASATITNVLRSRNPNDVLYQIGTRVPGTSWAVSSMRLLSRAEALQVSSTFDGDVDPSSGIGYAMVEVKVRQLKLGSNTLTYAANEDRGNYSAAEKTFYFNVQAAFLHKILQPVASIDDEPILTDQNRTSWCAANIETSSGSTQIQQVAARAPGATAQNTGFTPDPDFNEVALMKALPNGQILFLHHRFCNAANAFLPISECIVGQ